MEDTLCISRLKSMRKTAKKAEARLIDTVMCHISDMDNCTISSLAAEAGVSYATVCRLLEKIGVSGFKEFKKVLSQAPKKEKKEEITPDNLAICDRVCTDSLKMVENCKESLKNGVLDMAVEALSNAGTVMFTGLGASADRARLCLYRFLGILPQCFFSNDMIMAKMKASLLNKGDVLFAVSSSGKTEAGDGGGKDRKKLRRGGDKLDRRGGLSAFRRFGHRDRFRRGGRKLLRGGYSAHSGADNGDKCAIYLCLQEN